MRAHLTFVRIGVRYNSPDLGSTYLMWGFARWASAFGVEAFMAMQLFLTVSGALAIVVLRHAVRLLTPSVSDRAAILLFVLSGGLLRVLAGHVEVYNLLILASGLYLWASLAYLAGRSSLWVPSLALGGAIWVHASALCLIPSLLLLAGVERSDRGTPWIRVLAKLSLCAAPLLGFLAYASLFEPRWNLLLAWDSVERILGRKSTGHLTRLWVRGWGSYDSIGTDVVFLSSAHLKYLLNSLHLLAPLVLPILLAVTVLRPRRLVATPVNRFLLAAALPYVVYALSLRPFHGVWDWDLFSATALWLALLAACLLTQLLPAPSRPGALIWLIGVQALYVGIPFLLMGTLPICDGGPFFPGPRYAYPAIIQMNVPPPKALAPWL